MVKKKLIIVESPAKVKTISKYLGNKYEVIACKGHIRDLPRSRMGIDIENNFKPEYISIRGKGYIIKFLKNKFKNSNEVYIATDPDREGEAIAYHLSNILKLNFKVKNRIVFNEITDKAIKFSLKNKRKINKNLVFAQQTRRILDRLVGYSISPILWQNVKKRLSAGRVQSAVLNIISKKENEIKKFISVEYWKIDSFFIKENINLKFKAKLYFFENLNILKLNEKTVNKILDINLKYKIYKIINIEKNIKENISKSPFITSTLQQEAFKRIGFSTKKTMLIAQQLYEGLKINNKLVGLITYMRTDSFRISEIFKKESEKFIIKEFGEKFLKKQKENIKKNIKKNNIQDAHEAIRPTNILFTPKKIKKFLNINQYKLYLLIWNRFFSSQMANSKIIKIKYFLKNNKNIIFSLEDIKIKFDGFMKMDLYEMNYYKKMSINIDKYLKLEDTLKIIKIFKKKCFTKPPSRFNEASLVKILEKNGIGRPSTYSPIINILVKRYYIEIIKKQIFITKLGIIVDKLIKKFFKNIINIKFTALLEKKLDDISIGKEKWINIVKEFYSEFEKELKFANKNIKKIDFKDEKAGFLCEKCFKPMLIKYGKFGKFYGCSGFPKCKNIKKIFKKINIHCPLCKNGEIIQLKSKKNINFYGCINYPKCNFFSRYKILNLKCKKCNNFLVEKKIKNKKIAFCIEHPNLKFEI